MKFYGWASLSAFLCGLTVVGACSSSAQNSGVDETVPPGGNGPGGSNDGAGPGGEGDSSVPGNPPEGDASGPDGELPDEPPIPYVPFDINHVISTGQSNSVAHEGRPPISTVQPFANLMFDVGVMTSGDCEKEGCKSYQTPSSFVPLVEGDSFWWPVETMSSGLANEAAMLARSKYGKANHDLLLSLAGRNGLTYWCLRKNGCNYTSPAYVNAFAENLKQVENAKAIAAAAGKSYVVRMVTAIHGESDDNGYAVGDQEFPNDGTDGTPQGLKDYTDALIEWQRDYETGVKAITGQAQAVPLLISQFSGWNDISTSAITQMQFKAHERSNGKVVVVAPGYIFDWSVDCRHYTNHGERRLGEYFAKAYTRIVIEGRKWEPVRPLRVTHAGNVITAKFAVPVPPLVLDTTLVTNPGDYGFAAVDGAGNSIQVEAVALGGPDTVTITLATPVPAGARLRYAYTGNPHTCPGSTLGPRGNLRDSDTTPSNNGYSLFNWGLHFETPVE